MAPAGPSSHRALRFAMPWALLLSLSMLFAPVISGLVNVTVDDQLGDPTTGMIPEYLPNDGTWHVGSPTEDCPACNIQPSTLDLDQVYEQTWHDATYYPHVTPATITVRFTGSAVYVFNILPNTLLNTDTYANISFSIDGEDDGIFTRTPNFSPTILYNQLVYQNTALHNGPHTLIMTAAGTSSLILFDYLLYTTQSNETTSTTAPQDTSRSSSLSTPTSTSAPDSSHSSSFSPPTASRNNARLPSSFSAPPSTGIPNGSSQSSSSSTSLSTGTPTGESSQSPSSSTPVDAVIGAVVGGTALLGLTTGVFLLRRRRARSARPVQMQGGSENTHHGEYRENGAYTTDSATPISPPEPIIRSLDGALTDTLPGLASDDASGPHTRPSPSTADAGSRSTAVQTKDRVELIRRLEALQNTRSALSSESPAGCSQSEVSGGSATETVVRRLEAEIAALQGRFAALSAQLTDERRGDRDPEPLPAYAE